MNLLISACVGALVGSHIVLMRIVRQLRRDLNITSDNVEKIITAFYGHEHKDGQIIER